MSLEYFKGCDTIVERQNVVFYYPQTRLIRSPGEIADNLQGAFELVAAEYPNDINVPFKHHYSSERRLHVGYRSGKRHIEAGLTVDEPDNLGLCPGYWPPEQRVNIMWNNLVEGENSQGFEVPVTLEPEYMYAHELGHPFGHVTLEGNHDKEEWKEGVCDFGRLLILKYWSERDERFERLYQQYDAFLSDPPQTMSNRQYHYAAHLILKWYRSNGHTLSFAPLGELFAADMTERIGSWRA